jgi:hypothetical protein
LAHIRCFAKAILQGKPRHLPSAKLSGISFLKIKCPTRHTRPTHKQKAKREAHTHTITNKTNNERNNNMKLKVNWKELARQLWAAVRPVSVETKVK